jgi:glucose dehydrogenase
MHQRRQAGRWLACRESWRHETTPGETWDFNSNLEIVLADLQIDGRPRQVILHAPKNGSVFVIDRATGKLISAGPVTETTWATRIDLENWFRERVAASSSVSTWR